jgi:hypothetical protein
MFNSDRSRSVSIPLLNYLDLYKMESVSNVYVAQMMVIIPSPVLFLSVHISETKETPHVHYIIIII